MRRLFTSPIQEIPRILGGSANSGGTLHDQYATITRYLHVIEIMIVIWNT
jgi:hypothetical protein